jgi:hypothetical protein
MSYYQILKNGIPISPIWQKSLFMNLNIVSGNKF